VRPAERSFQVETCVADSGPWNPVAAHSMMPCTPLGAMLQEAGLQHVDVIAVDAEGSELEVLQGMDWSLSVCIWVLELQHADAQNDAAVQDLLEGKGYRKSPFDIASACAETFPQRCMLGNKVFVNQASSACDAHRQLALQKRQAGPLQNGNWAAQGEQGREKKVREVKADLAATERRHQLQDACDMDRDPPLYSQGREDLTLTHRYFCGKRRGTFVEIGALDGIWGTNTKFLEDAMGWRGALIEGNPANSVKLVKNRPRNKIFEMAVCQEGVGTLSFLGDAGGVGGAINTMAKSHQNQWNRAAKMHTVPCKPLGSILREARMRHVDLFSLDVEGAELAVLETMDWEIPVCIWVVELDGQNAAKDEKVRQLLLKKGYKKQSLWNINVACQSLQPNRKGDCMLGNEVFEHASLSTCGVQGGQP